LIIFAEAVVAKAAIENKRSLDQTILSEAKVNPIADEKTTVDDNLNFVKSK
jgi:hypothetical protein